MIRMIASAVMLAALAGCSSNGWNQYAEDHQCKATGKSQAHKSLEYRSVSSPSLPGYMSADIAPMTQIIPVPRTRTIFEYKCTNGLIWSYNSPVVTEKG